MPTRTRSSAATIAREAVIDDLNRLMAEETEACLRYFQMRYRLSPADHAVAGQLFDEAISETMEHAAAIAAHIKKLGRVPALRVALSLDGGPIRLEVALAEALEVEQQALDAYTDLLPRIAHDPALRAFVEQQIQVESEHVQSMRRFAAAHATMRPAPGSMPRRQGSD